ncbi:MAG: YdcF family protein, partial [Myxococcota bacterium]|nr:YdcF family protein [Myxococcota bacterium]
IVLPLDSGVVLFDFDAVMVLGKELRRDRERALRELWARCAAASVAMRRGVKWAVNLEAPLRGQQEAGSIIVQRMLTDLGVSENRIILDQVTRSTREEAVEGGRLLEERGWRRLLVLTTDYHVPRSRRYFEDVLGPGRVAVHAPTALLQGASPEERSHILAGVPSSGALRDERWVELLFGGFSRALGPLPRSLRWDVEVRAGALFRGALDRV